MGVYNAAVAACGLVITIWAVVEIIAKIVELTRKTNKGQDGRITALEAKGREYEKKFAEYDSFFKRDKDRLDGVDEAERVTQKAILALLSHAINGNDIDSLREARDSLETYLTNK